VEKQKELDGLFTQVLAALSKEGLISLEQVMQDGTKIKALASTRNYQREGTIQGHLERARQRVAEMGDPRNEETSPKARQAQARARREQQERLASALEELPKLQDRRSGEKAKSDARVSTSDPQARVMRHSDAFLSTRPQLTYPRPSMKRCPRSPLYFPPRLEGRLHGRSKHFLWKLCNIPSKSTIQVGFAHSMTPPVAHSLGPLCRLGHRKRA